MSLIALASAGCSNQGGDESWFSDVADVAGVDYEHDSGQREGSMLHIPEMTTGGAALFDMDRDGDLDLYFVQGGHVLDEPAQRPANRLYRNDGGFEFTDVSEASGATDRGVGQGVAAGDIDGDGDEDLFIANLGADVLLRNDGSGRFSDITESSGLGDPGWATSSSFLDYDRDGHLDLFVVRYLEWSPETEKQCRNFVGSIDYCSPLAYDAPAKSLLYRNEGDGRFSDVSDEAGITSIAGNGLGITTGDFNADGWIDVFVANDGMADRLWINQQDGAFRDEAILYGVAVDQGGNAKAGMGTSAADFDVDGDLDLIVCNLAGETDSYFVNQDGTSFIDRTIESGLAGSKSRELTRFGVGWLDFNNDGYLDLYQANGRVRDEISEYYGEDIYAEPNLLLAGTEDGVYEEVLPRGGTEDLLAATSRAAVFGDIDNDGGIDIVVVNRTGAPYVLRNQVAESGNWILFDLRERMGGSAIDAEVRVNAGETTVRKRATTAYSYLASNDPRIHLGLGSIDSVRDVTVTWSDGRSESFGDFAVNQVIELRRGQGAALP